MAQVPIFHGRVDDGGRMELADHERDMRRVWLQTLRGREIEVVVRKVRTQRSDSQNRYIHAVPFPILADEWGLDIETTKLICLGECFGWRDLPDGLRLPLKPSTSALTVEEMTHFIEWMPPWAMTSFRVNIPLPNEAEAA